MAHAAHVRHPWAELHLTTQHHRDGAGGCSHALAQHSIGGYTTDWAPRTRKRHQREHRPQRPTERSDATQHAKGRTGDCLGPRTQTATRRNVTQGAGGGGSQTKLPRPPLFQSLGQIFICAFGAVFHTISAVAPCTLRGWQ